MTTRKPCNTCSRPLTLDQFIVKRGKPATICRQCHAGKCAARRRRFTDAGIQEWRKRDACPLTLLLRKWRGPVTPEPLRWST